MYCRIDDGALDLDQRLVAPSNSTTPAGSISTPQPNMIRSTSFIGRHATSVGRQPQHATVYGCREGAAIYESGPVPSMAGIRQRQWLSTDKRPGAQFTFGLVQRQFGKQFEYTPWITFAFGQARAVRNAQLKSDAPATDGVVRRVSIEEERRPGAHSNDLTPIDSCLDTKPSQSS
jgi:hypothetical protein